MALVLKDRVKETTSTTGTGTVTLAGAATGFQSFVVVGDGNQTFYAIVDSASGAWEVGVGTYTSSGTTLSRTTVVSSSNAGSLVNFGAGTKDVFVTYPSSRAVYLDAAGSAVTTLDIGTLGVSTANITTANITAGTVSTAPVNNTDIVNKQYADAIASGIHFHEAVNLATTAALPANTYNNGTSGVGATLTGNANGALSVDSTLTIVAERILVKNEANGSRNGVYTVTQVGSAGTPYILTRATDFDSVGTGVDQIDEGDFFLVTSGTANVNTAWVQQTPPPITIGTTAIVFQQFSAPITYTAGTGLSESPTYTFNIANIGTAGTYGSASSVPVITTNAQGQVTGVTPTAIAISGAAVSGNISGSAGSVANALTAGTFLTSGGTFDGSSARTFAVDATSANTASKVVARDASGDFSAGTITATLSGSATSATTATHLAGGAANQIPFQTGSGVTSFAVAPSATGQVLGWNGSAFAWTTTIATATTATNQSGGTVAATTITASGTTTLSGNQIVSVTDNTNAALRITQLGTGNALLVEDSTNPDATPFVIDASGRVVLGYTANISTANLLELQSTGSATNFSFGFYGWSSGAGFPIQNFYRSKSGAIGTQGTVASGDNIGALRFFGDDNTAFIQAASITAAVDGTPGTSDMPGRLIFSTTADGASTPTERIRITSAGKTGFATAAPAATVHVAGDTILSNVNVLGASYDSVSFSVAAEETAPTDLFFSPDGLKMYIIGTTGDDVNEYNLSTAWVVSSAVFVTSFSVFAQENSPQGLFFRADGTKMYIVGSTGDTVFQYTLSTPWSVATASYDSISFSVATQETSPTGLSFRPNGLSMYVVGNTGDAVHQYTLSTAWNVSTATFLQSFSVSGQETVPNGVTFTGDGSRMFVVGTTGDDVNVYNLTTPWDISTSAFVNVFSVSAQDTAPVGIYIKPDGTKMYIMGQTNDTVFQYTVPSIDIQLTGPTSAAALDVQQDLTVYGNTQAYKITATAYTGINGGTF